MHLESKTARTFIRGFIASSIRNEIKKEVNNAHAYSLLLDESKDNSNHELLSVCVRYFYENGPVERFYEFIELHDLTSDGILNAIDHIISSFSSPLVCVATDGASVMTGAKNGVFAKLTSKFTVSEQKS